MKQGIWCLHCWQEFMPKQDPKGRGRPAKYCSAKCRTYASRARRRDREDQS